ncbi:MAG TPA: universal stress protein [Frankiaceae bacterium]|jgi:nucleotide-binding universal stress UspA family protein|nr:universal stress protein [Frankiaceae bacterium]
MTDIQSTLPRTSSHIVVGVDSSRGSSAALWWAVEQARRCGAVLRVVIAWELPTAIGAPVPLPTDFAPAALAHAAAEAEVRETLADAADVPVEIVVVEGHPRTVLLEAAKDATLLVVGRRGHSSWPGLTLGSVSEACARNAPCPVVVVNHPTQH